MSYYALRDFPLGLQSIAANTDLSAYPTGTLRYLRERGLVVTGTSGLKVAKAFGGLAVDATVNPANYSAQVLGRLIAQGYVVGSTVTALLSENGDGAAMAFGAPQVGSAPTLFGSTWGRDGSGAFGCTAGGNEGAVLWDIGLITGYKLECDLVTVGGDAGIVFNATTVVGLGRWLMVYLSGNYPIYNHNAGAGGYVVGGAGSGAAATAGDHVVVTRLGNVITCIVNGVQRSTYDFSAIAVNLQDTKVGFRENFSTVNRFDNLVVTPYP